MRIGIDARFWGLENTGIGRYVMELVGELVRLDNKNEYFIFLRQNYFDQLTFDSPRVTKVLADLPHYSFAEQWGLPRLVRLAKVDLMHYPHFNVPLLAKTPFVMTIHDLIKHQSRGLKTTTRGQGVYFVKHLAYRLLVYFSIRKAQKIIVPSQWWLKELVGRYRFCKGKVVVVSEGVAPALKTNANKTAQALRKYRLSQPFLLYVGNLYPHKNVELAVRAMAKTQAAKNLKLVIVSARTVFRDRFNRWLEKSGLGQKVVLVDFVTDQELASLYRAATVFLFPSRLEGFGLPGLEAMAAGTPVVAAWASCLPEVYSQAALYFDPDSEVELSQVLKRVLTQPSLAKKLSRLGRKQAALYSWTRAAIQTNRVYEEVLVGQG
ncbi:glycosyltransferase family 4 protein [Patescibacteria group bacterium]|nr:glycosyltransferase family 4 protein [Patescibacteria group bacterium]